MDSEHVVNDNKTLKDGKMRWRLFVCISLMGVVLGCSQKEDAPESPADSVQSDMKTDDPGNTANEPAVKLITFDHVLQLYAGGQQDKAVDLFLKIQWDQPDIFAQDSVFQISEAEFVGSPRSEQEQISQKASNVSKEVKALAKYTIQQAKEQGGYEPTRNALIACGKRLSQDDQLLLIQMVGKAVVGYTEKELPVW